MSMVKSFLGGAVSVLAGDLASGFVPAQVDVGGLPIRKYGTAGLALWLVHKATGHNAGLVNSLIVGAVAQIAADLKTKYVPTTTVTVMNVDVLRAVAGGAGGAVVGHFMGGGVEAAAEIAK